jgi:hypothetical protein
LLFWFPADLSPPENDAEITGMQVSFPVLLYNFMKKTPSGLCPGRRKPEERDSYSFHLTFERAEPLFFLERVSDRTRGPDVLTLRDSDADF